MKAYKVVVRHNGMYVSCWTYCRRDLIYGACEYDIGVTTVPYNKCGPLCAFKDLNDAINFANVQFLSTKNIFECEVEPEENAKNIFVKDKVQKQLPKGTILCKSIKLTRRVFEE